MQNRFNTVGKLSSLAALLATGLFVAQGQASAVEAGSLEIESALSTTEDVISELNVPTSFELASTDILDVSSLQEDDLGQVTSVSQLSDVQPTDWAFQALQSLNISESHGCNQLHPLLDHRSHDQPGPTKILLAFCRYVLNVGYFTTKYSFDVVNHQE